MVNSKTTIYLIANKNQDSAAVICATMAQAKKYLPIGSDWSIIPRQVSAKEANSQCLDIIYGVTPRF